MEIFWSYLKKPRERFWSESFDFRETIPKNSAEEALQKLRKLCFLVKNRKRRFRFTADPSKSKRYEAAAKRRTNQERELEQLLQLLLQNNDAEQDGEEDSDAEYDSCEEELPLQNSGEEELPLQNSGEEELLLQNSDAEQDSEEEVLLQNNDAVNVNVNNSNDASAVVSQHDQPEIFGGKGNYPNNLKDNIALFFVVTNFFLEIPSLVLEQLTSLKHPQYVFTLMLISAMALMICIMELIWKGKSGRYMWKWRGRNRIPWFYCPQTHQPLGNLWEFIGVACAVPQLIITAINYSFIFRHRDGPIKITALPLILPLLYSALSFWSSPEETAKVELWRVPIM